MFRKKLFSSNVLIALLVVCVLFSTGLIGCTPETALDDSGNGTPAPGGATGEGGEEDALPAPTVTEWVLPIVVSITGAESDAGLAAAWGFDYGIKVVNEQGGIRGIPVRITIRDAASSDTTVTTEIGSAAADALIVIGPPTESLYKAGEQAFYSAGMPAVGAATDNDRRELYQPFAISCITTLGSDAVSAAETWVRAEHLTKVCMFYSPAYAERTARAEETLLASGIEVVEKIEIANASFDAVKLTDKAIASSADAFYVDLNKDDTLRVVKQLKFSAGAGDAAGAHKILCGPQVAAKELIGDEEAADLIGVRVWAMYDPNKDNEKRRVFEEAYNKNIEDPAYYSIAVDYYQSALMLKQAIDTLGLTGAPDVLAEEREKLAAFLYNTGLITTEQGDFIIESGSKETAVRLYTVTDKDFQM